MPLQSQGKLTYEDNAGLMMICVSTDYKSSLQD